MKLPKRLERALDWIRYSGGSVMITFNPLHWRKVPKMQIKMHDDFYGSKYRSVFFIWLFFQIYLYIDNGDW